MGSGESPWATPIILNVNFFRSPLPKFGANPIYMDLTLYKL